MSLIRRDHIAGHTHDRSRSSSIDGEIDYSLWTLEKVLQWLEDNSFSEYKQIFIDFFALRDLRKIKHLLKNETEGRYKLITAIRKIGERPSFSDKSSQDLLGGLRDTYGSLSYSPTTHNSSQTRLSAPSLLEATTNKTLKLSTSFPDLRNANNHQNNHSFSPTINPRSSSIDNEKWSKPTILTSIPFLSQDPHDQSPYHYNNNNGYFDDKTPKDSIPSTTSTLNNFTNLPKHNFQLTFDFKNFRLVELSGDEPRSKIKRVIFSQLDIDPNDCENYTFHLTELGQKEIGPRLEDNDLIHKCLNADDRGTLKFFVKHRSTTEPIYHNLPIMASQNELRANSSPSSFYTGGKYFSGGFNPTLQEGWKSTEEFSPITAEPSDDLQDIKHELVDTIENVSSTSTLIIENNNNNNKDNKIATERHNNVVDSTENNSNHSNEKKISDSSKGGGKLARAVSLRRGVESWIVRPTTEDVLENLEQFFPGHDLDKPITETPGTPVTPVTPAPPQNASQQEEISPPSKVITEKSNGSNGDGGRSGNGGAKITRYKSIRSTLHEVHEREKNKRFIEAVNAVKANNQRLARKPTTKFWGKKAVEQRPMKFCEQNAENNIMQDKTTNCSSLSNHAVKWVKGELIGKGTFGKVYIALNVTTSEMMAVKQVETPRTRSDEINQRQRNMVKSFKDEMKILKDLDHDHIVQYIGYEENEEEVNIFLEYVNGGSIGTYLRMNGPLKEPVVRSFTRQILLGLEYLHNEGILHRDIKADNILVNEDGICKISDFGISKKSGTIFWMAPEVFTKGYSAKVDIWSLGCVVLEMFAGERPWPNLSDLAAMFKLGSEKKAPPIREDLIMSAEARDCLDKCFIMPTAKDLLQSHPFVHDDPDFHFKDNLFM
nr:906_t:CDS:10 [Entrophospora candida]